jgi:hypothetical protein
MTVPHILELTAALQRRTLALFIGADLPHDATGLPSRADLARDLAHRQGLDASLSLAEVAQRVSKAGNRWTFTAFIRDALDTVGKSPRPFHRHIAELVKTQQVETLITTAYDNLLELAFQQAGLAIDRVVRGSDLAFASPGRPMLIKLYGDAQQPDTLVVTEDDQDGLWRNRDKEDVLDQVRLVLRRNAILFLGYNPADPDFRPLWREVLDRMGRFARTAYAAWPGLPEDEKQVWADRQVRVIEMQPLALLEELVEATSSDQAQEPFTKVMSTAAMSRARRDSHISEQPPGADAGRLASAPSPPSRYHNVEILIGDRQGAGYPVHVLTSPAGEGEGLFVPPFTEDEWRDALDRLERGDTDQAALAEVGTCLFSSLFGGDVRARYAESVGLASAGAGLRIRLRLDPPELQALPWELLHDPEKREFLVLSKRSLVTRYLHVPRPAPPLEIAPPLRVLVAVAAPEDWTPLPAGDEVAGIRQALRPLVDGGLLSLAVEPHATKQGLRQHLLGDAPHVLHYVGHGGLADDRGVLILEDGQGRSDPLDGPTLGTLLKGSSVRLAVLNACLSARPPVGVGLRAHPTPCPSNQGGYGAPPRPSAAVGVGLRAHPARAHPALHTAFMGVGPALVDAGLGAVVAMQFSVDDRSARVFATDFYGMLARFKPVDECVSRAREALLLEVGRERRDWATPVLYLRAPDGQLFASPVAQSEPVPRHALDRPPGESHRENASPAAGSPVSDSSLAPTLTAAQRRRLEQRRDELQGPLATYDRRVAALESGLARELDGERRAVLEERLWQAKETRDRTQAEIDKVERQLGEG